MDREKINYLYSRYKAQQLSPEEEKEWAALLADPEQDPKLRSIVGADWDGLDLRQLKSLPGTKAKRILNEILLMPQFKVQRKNYWWSGAAAAVAILILATWFFNPFGDPGDDITPGGNRATLILADGQRIELSPDHGVILFEGDQIRYSDGSPVHLYATDDGSGTVGSTPQTEIKMLTLSTPKGGEYQVVLSDGSKVWMNAASTLHYPMNFVGQTNREVTLHGEAYFEIAEDRQHPFRVIAGEQSVEVLGTHFVISAYSDDPEIKTTLAEGSVEVSTKSASMILQPDQQSVLKDGVLTQREVFADEETAWVTGEFQFNDESLVSIMRKLSRWYDVEVRFEDEHLKTEAFYGIVSRFDQISQVLSKLEQIGDVRFQIKGNTVHVQKK